jgi:hypothetical protein
VIYGPRGALVEVHNVESLGLRADLQRFTRSVSSLDWDRDRLVFFGPDEDVLVIRLYWGKLLFIDLATGRVANGALSIDRDRVESLKVFASKRIPELCIQMLESTDVEQRLTAARLCGSMKLLRSEAGLRRLLKDNDWVLGANGQEKVYHVREAAKEALGALGAIVEEGVVEGGDTGSVKPSKKD